MHINKTKTISTVVSVLVSTLLVAGVAFAITTISGTIITLSNGETISNPTLGTLNLGGMILTKGAHPTQDVFQVGATGNNGTIIGYAEDVSSFRLAGLNYISEGGTYVQSYAGVFGNDQFDSPGLGLKKTRVIYGSNEDMDIEIQGSNAVLISATDDAIGLGFVKIAANAQVDIHPYASGDTIGVKRLTISRVSTANFGAANTSDVTLGTNDGKLYLQYGTVLGGVVFPNMTSTERDALTGVAGETIFNTTTTKLEVWDGSAWKVLW